MYRETLVDVDVDFGGKAQGFEGQLDHLPGCVAAIGGDAGVVGGEAKGGSLRRTGGDGYDVVEREGLVDGDQPVEAVGARRSYIEAEIDLGVGTDGCGHTRVIVERGIC